MSNISLQYPGQVRAAELFRNVVSNLVVGQEAGQRVDQEASLEELGVDPVVGDQSLADLACAEAPAVPLARWEEVGAD